MPGFVSDPSSYYERASLFVLSSDWEGLPTVLIESLAYGVPIVSTDCPSGPSEILSNGKFGSLIEMQDPEALAGGMLQSLSSKHNTTELKLRAQEFSIDKAVKQYENILFNEYN